MVCPMFLTLSDDVKMPAVGYGTWQFDDASLEEGLEVALEVGYRHIDTAAVYFNEAKIGTILKKWFDSGKLKREDIFITTKLNPMDMDPKKVEADLQKSLRQLQLDYVDLYLMHFPLSIISDGIDSFGDPKLDYLDIWKKMEEQHEKGRAKFIGVSNFSVKKLQRILDNCKVKPANNQVEVHVYLQQKELLKYCKEKGIPVVAYSPLGCRVYDKYLGKMGIPPRHIQNIFDDKLVEEIAKKHQKTSGQVALRFLLQLGVAVIPKSFTPNRIKENFDLFEFELDEDDMIKLYTLDRGEQGRIWDWKETANMIGEHPDYEF